MSNIAIAKKLGLSARTVKKIIDAMIRDGVISIKAVPNPAKMGNPASALIGLNVDTRKINNICVELKKVPNIHIMVATFGRFDLFLMTFFPDWITLENFTKTKLKKINGILSVYTFLSSENKMGSYGLFNNVSSEDNESGLDAMDRKLVSELMNNGRLEYSDLVTKLGTSRSTISRRISSLIDKDIISIKAIPNLNLEYSADAFILVSADFSKIDDICKKLVSYPETHLVMKLMNDYDILLTINSTNREELYKFITGKVANIDGVLKSETFLVAKFLHFNTYALLGKQ